MTTPDLTLQSLAMMPRADVEALHSALVLDADMAWINHFGEHVWIGPVIRDGVRIGVTDCCAYDWPCAHHTRLTQEKP